MKILLDGRKIVAYGNEITFDRFENESFEKWRILVDDSMYYMIDNGFTLIEGVTLPPDYVGEKYFYEDGEFVLNEEWKPYISTEERITQLEEQVAQQTENEAELLYQVSLMQLGITDEEV